eukprot:c17736_g1_i1 orf=222-887(-)
MAAPCVSGRRQRRSSALCSLLQIIIVLAICLTAGIVEARRVSEEVKSQNSEGSIDVSMEKREMQATGVVYCVAKPNADTSKLQDALDWTCGTGSTLGSVDCSAIQKGGSCYDPDTVEAHASYAFTLYYYHQSAASHACDFNGLATLTTSNPSSGTCVYPSSAISGNPSSTSPNSSGTLSPPAGTSFSFPGSPAPSPSEAPSHAVYFGSISLLSLLPLLMLL